MSLRLRSNPGRQLTHRLGRDPPVAESLPRFQDRFNAHDGGLGLFARHPLGQVDHPVRAVRDIRENRADELAGPLRRLARISLSISISLSCSCRSGAEGRGSSSTRRGASAAVWSPAGGSERDATGAATRAGAGCGDPSAGSHSSRSRLLISHWSPSRSRRLAIAAGASATVLSSGRVAHRLSTRRSTSMAPGSSPVRRRCSATAARCALASTRKP